MKENQHIEWKEPWRDEYLKWISGFANAEGGVLVIGRNDKGTAVGVNNARKLLEDLSNKIRDVLGIMVAVNLLTEAGRELVEVRVEPYPSPISYKGQYHYRSGSTKQELRGVALEQFLLRKRASIGTVCRSPPFLPKPAVRTRFGSSSRGQPAADAWTNRCYGTAVRSFSTIWNCWRSVT